jgi:hypothetical protein
MIKETYVVIERFREKDSYMIKFMMSLCYQILAQ